MEEPVAAGRAGSDLDFPKVGPLVRRWKIEI
jgi:hypothetical protein